MDGVSYNKKSVLEKLDNAPTAGSDNAVKSDGIKTYVDAADTSLSEALANEAQLRYERDQDLQGQITDVKATQTADTFVFKGSVATISDLPAASGATIGDTYYVESEHCNYSAYQDGSSKAWAKSSGTDLNVMKENIATDWSATRTYKAGEIVMYNDVTYVRKADGTAADGTWDGNLWTRMSVGEQVGNVNNALSYITSLPDFLDLNSVEITIGSYLKVNGTIGSNSSLSVTDYIEVPYRVQSVTVNRVAYTAAGVAYPQSHMVWWYDENKELLGNGSETTTDNLLTSVKTYSSAKYFRVNLASYKIMPFILLNKYDEFNYVRHLVEGESADDINDMGLYLVGVSGVDGLPPSYVSGLLCIFKTAYSNRVQLFARSTVSSSTFFRCWMRGRINGAWSSWKEITNNPDETLGLVGVYSGEFTQASQQLNTQITLMPNKTYCIKFYGDRTGDLTVFGSDNLLNYKSVLTYYDEVYFTNDETPRYLILYNTRGSLDAVSVAVFETDSVKLKAETIPRVYRVRKDNAIRGDYTSLTQCLLDLKDDNAPKTIEIWEGDYDIYQEYVDANVPVYTGTNPNMDYFDYCVWVPENTHIIGKGIVRLQWMPNPTDNPEITPNQCRCVSPLNVAATATIENIEVHCKNGRYCLHNDGLGKLRFTGAVQKYINCSFYKYENDIDTDSGQSYGFAHTTGFGIDRSMQHIYEDCDFYNKTSGRAFYGHSRGTVGSATLTENMSSDILLKNCICDNTGITCIKFGNGSNSNLHIRVKFESCYISGLITAIDESGDENYRNAYDLTFLDCGDVNLHIGDSDNRYPPKAYRTVLDMQ